MGWTSPLNSRPLRPVPVLWLLVPWTGLLVASVGATASALAPPPTAGWDGLFAAMALGTQRAIGLWGGMLGLPLTWLWLALAVPGIRRPGLWLAAACYAAPWLPPAGRDLGQTGVGVSLLCCAGCLGVLHSVALARLRAREVWGGAPVAGV